MPEHIDHMASAEVRVSISALFSDDTVEALARAAHKRNGMWVRLGLPLSAMSDDYQENMRAAARAAIQTAIDAAKKAGQ